MQCLYCAEEIKDQAIACQHCGRDFIFLRPLMDRVVDLERQLSELALAVAAGRSASDGAGRTAAPETVIPWLATACVASIATILLDVTAALASSSHDLLSTSALIASYLVPVAAGAWIGMSVVGRHLLLYLWTGFLIGLAEQLFLITTGSYTGVKPLLLQIFIPMFLFVSGGLFGDMLELRTSRNGVGRTVAGRFASVIVGSRGGDVGGDARVKRLATVIQAIGPVLTMITALGTAYLGRSELGTTKERTRIGLEQQLNGQQPTRGDENAAGTDTAPDQRVQKGGAAPGEAR